MVELTLTFCLPPRATLIATHSVHHRLKAAVTARLGAYDQSFRWTAGVKALSVLLLRYAAWGRHGRGARSTPPCLEGKRPSLAASLNDVMTGKPQWVNDVFGAAAGRHVLLDLLDRWNPDFNSCPSAPVLIRVKSDQLPPEAVRVVVDGQAIEDPLRLHELAEEIVGQQQALKERMLAPAGVGSSEIVVGGAPSDNVASGVNGRLVSDNHVVTIEIVLNRDFDSFGREDEERLVRVVKAVLTSCQEIRVVGTSRGSVIVTLELPPEGADELLHLVAAGAISELGVVSARLVDADKPPMPSMPMSRSHWRKSTGRTNPIGGQLRTMRQLTAITSWWRTDWPTSHSGCSAGCPPSGGLPTLKTTFRAGGTT